MSLNLFDRSKLSAYYWASVVEHYYYCESGPMRYCGLLIHGFQLKGDTYASCPHVSSSSLLQPSMINEISKILRTPYIDEWVLDTYLSNGSHNHETHNYPNSQQAELFPDDTNCEYMFLCFRSIKKSYGIPNISGARSCPDYSCNSSTGCVRSLSDDLMMNWPLSVPLDQSVLRVSTPLSIRAELIINVS